MSGPLLTLDAIRDAFPPNSPRVAHISGVAAKAGLIEELTGKFDGQLVLAALYHDAGSAMKWKQTGFHPVDGALLARSHGLGTGIQDAILNHTGSWLEMRLSRPDLASYYGEQSRMMDISLARALTYCDMHTGPMGQDFSLQERLDDIRRRYADNPTILRVMSENEGRFMEIADEFSDFFTAMPREKFHAAG